MDNRPDRMKSIEDQFSKIDLRFTRFNAIKSTNGVNGCRKSHLEILKDAKNKGYNKIIICEDDLVLRRSIQRDISEIMNDVGNFDLLYFHHPQPSDVFYTGKTVTKHQAPWCTHFYVVGNIENVLNHVLSRDIDNMAIDNIYVNSNLNCFITVDEYAFQLADYSDISGAVVDRFAHRNQFMDLLVPHEYNNIYLQYIDIKNRIFIPQHCHSGMGDIILFLSKLIELADYFGNHHIVLSNEAKKRDLIKEIIPLIDPKYSFEWTDDQYTIPWGWGDFANPERYVPLKEEYKWKTTNSNILTYQLNGAQSEAYQKNCTLEELRIFLERKQGKELLDLHMVKDFNMKVKCLLMSDEYYGIDSGNTHLACMLKVPSTLIKNQFCCDILPFKKLKSFQKTYDIKG